MRLTLKERGRRPDIACTHSDNSAALETTPWILE